MDAEAPQAAGSPEGRVAGTIPKRHRGAGAFVAVFTVCVLLMLTGYRFAINSTANDRYLFELSRHTTWILAMIGHSAELEKYTGTGLDAASVRSRLSEGSPVQSDQETSPLSPWERWRYRALTRRDGTEIGPRITFVLRPGLQQELEAREARQRALRAGTDAVSPEDAAALDQQIAMLRARLAETAQDPGSRRERQGLSFTFIVVPSCGAIEVMAIFLAAVVAFPTTWRHRAWGMALGLPLMYIVNIARLACLACLGAVDDGGAWFNFVHEYVWQAGYVIFVVLGWMAWVELDKGSRA